MDNINISLRHKNAICSLLFTFAFYFLLLPFVYYFLRSRFFLLLLRKSIYLSGHRRLCWQTMASLKCVQKVDQDSLHVCGITKEFYSSTFKLLSPKIYTSTVWACVRRRSERPVIALLLLLEAPPFTLVRMRANGVVLVFSYRRSFNTSDCLPVALAGIIRCWCTSGWEEKRNLLMSNSQISARRIERPKCRVRWILWAVFVDLPNTLY